MKHIKGYDEFVNEGFMDFLNIFNPFRDDFKEYRKFIYNKVSNDVILYNKLAQILRNLNFREDLFNFVKEVYLLDTRLVDLVTRPGKYVENKFFGSRLKKFTNMGVKKFVLKFRKEYDKMSDNDLKNQIYLDLKDFKNVY